MKKKLDREKLAKQAFEECASPDTTVRYGVKRGRPFWNVESTQFMYVPAFHFTAVRCCGRYRYTAIDEQGKEHFIGDVEGITPCSLDREKKCTFCGKCGK